MESCIQSECLRIGIPREVTSLLRSGNLLVSRVGPEFLASMPRTTLSTPTPPPDAAQTDATAPVPASPAGLPDSLSNQTFATCIDPNTAVEELAMLYTATLEKPA